MTRSHDNEQYCREHYYDTRPRNPGPISGPKYVCLYCGQGCSSPDILVAHERDCPLRSKKEAEWRQARKRHTTHFRENGQNDYRDK